MARSIFHEEWRGFYIAPPYAMSSPESKLECQQIHALHKELTFNQIFRIRHEDETSTTQLFVEILKEHGFKLTKSLVKRCETLEVELLRIASHYKNRFKRPRPQRTFESFKRKQVLPPTQSTDEFAYPSSRAVAGLVIGRYLADAFPRATPTLEEYGKQLGWNRVRAGWSHASDYAMGRVLAEHLWKYFNEEGLE